MGASSSNRIKAADDRPPKGKAQALPLLCVEAICKFTQTSKLVRLYSAAVPLPGAWSLGLEAVLKKRRPFSLSEDLACHRANDPTRISALFDASGSKFAIIKHPKAFQFSPLCEFVQSATLPFVILPGFAAAEGRLRYVITGEPLLPHLQNVSKLTVIDLGNFENLYGCLTLGDYHFLLPSLKEMLTQLEYFAVEQRHNQMKTLDLFRYLVDMLPDVAVLKHLDVPYLRFETLMRAATAGCEQSEAVRHVLSGLSSIHLRRTCSDHSHGLARQCVDFMSRRCTHLTHLSIVVEGEFKPFLIALLTLVNLTTLGLELASVKTTGITFSEDEAVHSISVLRLDDKNSFRHSDEADATEIAIASLFPSVTKASLDCGAFAAKLCQQQVWPQLAELTCSSTFNCFEYLRANGPSRTQFLASPYLPSVVDLSPVIREYLSSDSDMLTDIYQAVQKGSVETLLLRGPVHREALSRLQAHIDSHGENANVTAWKDRDLGAQTDIVRYGCALVKATQLPEQTDVRISGTKEEGGQFSIRVVHQHTKKRSDMTV